MNKAGHTLEPQLHADWIFFYLKDNGMVLVHDDGRSFVMSDQKTRTNIEVIYQNEIAIKVICNSIYKENFIPLDINQLGVYVLGMKLNRPFPLILN